MNTEDFERWRGRALDLGADEATVMRARDVVVADWVRMKCLFGCDDPTSHRTCPPNAPSVDQTRRSIGESNMASCMEAGPITGAGKSDEESLRLNRAGLALSESSSCMGSTRRGSWAPALATSAARAPAATSVPLQSEHARRWRDAE